MKKYTIYHNPRCSKSRQTLELMKEHDVDPDIVLYLENPPDRRELKSLLTMLGLKPRDLLRKSEPAYKDMNLADPSLSDEQIIDAMLEEPKLIERPIVAGGGKAVLGRPPENVLSLIE